MLRYQAILLDDKHFMNRELNRPSSDEIIGANTGLRNDSFRNYADYMGSPEFEHAMKELIALGAEAPTAYMCAERVYFHCHRMLVSDWLVAHGHEVLHIDGSGPAKPHKLTAEARILDGRLIYRGDRLL